METTRKTTDVYTIEGIRPLLLANGRAADPLDEFAVAMKEIRELRTKRTDDDYLRERELSWLASIYYDPEIGFYMPSANIDQMLIDGAKKSTKGTVMKTGVECAHPHVLIRFPRIPNCPDEKDLDAVQADKRFRFERRVKGASNSRIIAVNAMIPTGWQMDLQFDYDTDCGVKLKDIEKALERAGSLVGLGGWRPKFGRFMVVE